MYLKPKDFIGNLLLYVIYTTHPENIQNLKSNIIINFDVQNSLNLPSDTNIGMTVYIIVFSEKLLEFDVIRSD